MPQILLTPTQQAPFSATQRNRLADDPTNPLNWTTDQYIAYREKLMEIQSVTSTPRLNILSSVKF